MNILLRINLHKCALVFIVDFYHILVALNCNDIFLCFLSEKKKKFCRRNCHLNRSSIDLTKNKILKCLIIIIIYRHM